MTHVSPFGLLGGALRGSLPNPELSDSASSAIARQVYERRYSPTALAFDVPYDPGFASSVATSVPIKLRETVSVFDFMTKAQIADVQSGTGSIDATASIQAALDAAKKVRAPAGKYLLTAVGLKINHDDLELYGDGPVTNFTFPAGTSFTAPAQGAIYGLNRNRVYLHDFEISSTNAYNSVANFSQKGIHIHGAGGSYSDVRVERVTVEGVAGEAIYADGSSTVVTNVAFVDNTVRNCSTNALNFNMTAAIGTGMVIADNYVENCGGSAVLVVCKEARITGNYATYPNAITADPYVMHLGTYFEMIGNLIVNSVLTGGAVSPIHIGLSGVASGARGLVANNVVMDNVTVNVNQGGPICIEDYTGELFVTGNVVSANGRSTDGPSPAVSIRGSSTTGKITIAGNHFIKGAANNQDKGVRIETGVPASNGIRVGLNYYDVATPYDFLVAPSLGTYEEDARVIEALRAFLPHPARISKIQAGTNITIVENALGPVISAAGASAAPDNDARIVAFMAL